MKLSSLVLGMPKMFLQHLIYFSQNQQEMADIFMRLIWWCAWCCSSTEQYVFSCMSRSHQNGMVQWCVCFEQWVVTKFLVPEKESVTNTHKQLKYVYRVVAVCKSTVSHWAPQTAGSERGQVELSQADCSGHPITAVTHVLVQHAEELIWYDWWITSTQHATELKVPNGSVNNITDALAYSKVCTSWIPWHQTYYQKTVKEEACSDLLSCYEADGASSWSLIITRVETWLH